MSYSRTLQGPCAVQGLDLLLWSLTLYNLAAALAAALILCDSYCVHLKLFHSHVCAKLFKAIENDFLDSHSHLPLFKILQKFFILVRKEKK